MFSFNNFSIVSYMLKMCKPHCTETTKKNKQVKNILKTWISNSHLIRQSFYRYLCESGIVIFAWSLNYSYKHAAECLWQGIVRKPGIHEWINSILKISKFVFEILYTFFFFLPIFTLKYTQFQYFSFLGFTLYHQRIELNSKQAKCVTSYDLPQIFIGKNGMFLAL